MTRPGAAEDVSPLAVAAVEEALRAFAKALRATQLYLPNNPVLAQSLEHTRRAFSAVWSHGIPLTLRIKETSLEWEGRTVLLDVERGTEGLPWLLYRDGVRSLTLHAGFEAMDLHALLGILHAARTASPDADDLVTTLWVAGLATVEYRHVDSASTGGPVDEGADDLAVYRPGFVSFAIGEEAADGPTDAREGEAGGSAGAAPPSGLLRMDDFDSTLHFLRPGEIAQLQDELEREYADDHRQRVLTCLFDLIGGIGTPDAQREAVAVLDTLLVEFLMVGDYELVTVTLREASVLARRTTLEADVVTALQALPARLSEPAAMQQLLQVLDEALRTPSSALLESLFMQLRPSALEPLVAWIGAPPGLVAPPSQATRTVVEQAVQRLAATHTSAVARLLDHEHADVVRGAVRLVAQLATPAAVPGLTRLVRAPDPALRLEVVSALGTIASPSALQAVERAIDDDDREVRIAALRVLAACMHTLALPRIGNALLRKELRGAELSEKMALFETFGTLCGESGVPKLDALLNAHGMLGPKEPSDIRACAARALGLVGTPLALAALERSASTKDVVVRSAVTRALRGAP
ncbi:MAG: HEAT repeat domain-containing protein [Gemmatimonadota bacterium]|nr:HEAT repeat domain-containing protein [Gemmatimonadota bacterium]MDQ8171320.1 HEAT repeat domain-containing protein [Gemmatimonadota bacterium]